MIGDVSNAKAYMELIGFGYTPINSDVTLGNPVAINTLLQSRIISVYYLGRSIRNDLCVDSLNHNYWK